MSDGHAWSCGEGAHLELEDRGCHDEPPEQFNTKVITLATSGRPPRACTHNQRGIKRLTKLMAPLCAMYRESDVPMHLFPN